MLLEEQHVGQRLDRALVAALADRGDPCSRSQLARAFAAGLVTVDGAAVKPSRVVERPLSVELVRLAAEPLRAEPEELPLTVVFEDEHLLVVDKPAGMVVHAGPGHPRGTLVNAILFHLGARPDDLPVMPGNDATRPGIVHRIDKDTSGLLVVAKHLRAQEGLAVQFREHTIRRAYLGIVCGVPRWESKSVRTLHGRDPRDRRRCSPQVERGRTAVTHAWRERVLVDAACLRFRLETGRTHQIRMHARHLGHPLVGDVLYGARAGSDFVRAAARRIALDRHALHAAELGFLHPVDKRAGTLEFSSPLPPELQRLIAALEP